MVALFETGVSALLATQRALATTGHNISNVNTPGFSRQRVALSTREAQLDEGGFRGRGVQVAGIDRMVDQFATAHLRTAATNEAHARQMLGDLRELNNLLGDADSGIMSALSGVFAGMGDLAGDPSSQAVRGVVIDALAGLVDRFRGLGARLSDLAVAVNAGIESSVQDLNELARSLATLNGEITRQASLSTAGPPNDLLDRRDELLRQMSEITRVHAVPDARGAVSVSIGNGQSLVSGTQASPLTTLPNVFDPTRLEVAYVTSGAPAAISDLLEGGRLAAHYDFQREALSPARRELGRIAVALAEALNTQHRMGMDLQGNLGNDLLALPAPAVLSAAGNTGTVGLTWESGGSGALTADEYRLDFDGSLFHLRNLSRGTVTTLGSAGAGPFVFDGLRLSVTAPPVAGDRWLIAPTLDVAGEIALRPLRPADLAAAAPVVTARGAFNTGDATISTGEVLDPGHPQLLAAVQLVFDTPGSFRVNGVGPSIAYTTGGNIDLHGWRVQITGSPRAGDVFSVMSNAGGTGDSRNAVLMAGVERRPILDGGRSTLAESYASVVSRTGSRQRQGEVAHTALKTVLDRSVARQQEVSGVNLDEEAANLLRFQQAYQAAAQIIATADTVFQTLIDATRR
jgi:flagellar hook-associated protein 1 FlgK